MSARRAAIRLEILKYALLAFVGFASGLTISGAVFAFIAIIGLVPRMAQKTKTIGSIKIYETAIMLGGIFGASTEVVHYYLPIGRVLTAIFSFGIGIFYGTLALCLTEILNVIPILARRSHLKDGLTLFILAIAFGKMAGSIIYYVIPGFYSF